MDGINKGLWDSRNFGIVPEPLIDYRTAPASSNVKSMSKRLELMRFIIRKHNQSYQAHIEDAILGIETISMSRLDGWEKEICHTLKEKQILSQASKDFIKSPSYGDGGMAAAVRIASNHQSTISALRTESRRSEKRTISD